MMSSIESLELPSDDIFLQDNDPKNTAKFSKKWLEQLCEDTGCSPEDRPEVINDREKWRERVRDIRASDTTG